MKKKLQIEDFHFVGLPDESARPVVVDAGTADENPNAAREVQAALDDIRNHDIDLQEIRERLEKEKGPQFWRSLDELAQSDAFHEMVKTEFPQMAAGMDPLDRRSFLKLMGASMALMGLAACTKQPEELIVPYVVPPEDLVPGKPMYFATLMTLGGYAMGLLAESNMGRPTKMEGNPSHPASLGSSDAFAQASVLELYDPDRSASVLQRGKVSTWDSFVAALGGIIAEAELVQGDGLRILTETVTSPTLAAQIGELLVKLPKAKWHQYDPVNRDSVVAGAVMAFGEPVETVYEFNKADVVLALDSDFLQAGPAHVRYARDFASRRIIAGPDTRPLRLYAVESTCSVTGAKADHRLPVTAAEVEIFARALARELGVPNMSKETCSVGEAHGGFFAALADDLKSHKGASVVIAGDEQPAAVHALAHAINAKLGNVQKTVVYLEPVAANPGGQVASLKELVGDMESSLVDVLVMIGGNPVYNTPADLDFASALNNVKTRIRLGRYLDETSRQCHWHVPHSHGLEAWGDARAYDGTASICQPLIEPLYGSKSAVELMSAMLGRSGQSGLDTVKAYWVNRLPAGDAEKQWRRVLHDGLIEGTAAPVKRVNARIELEPREAPPVGERPAPALGGDSSAWEGLEVVVRPDPSVWDGRYANNGWLQELPKPVTRTTWGNVIEVSPADAQRMSLQNEDVVELANGERFVTGPVWISPGQARGSVTVTLGYGRTDAGRVGSDVGFNTYALTTSSTPSIIPNGRLIKTGEKEPIANTQKHQRMEGRQLVRAGTFDAFQKQPDFAHHLVHEFPESFTVYNPPYDYSKGNQWGMVINLNACIGCNACMIACQAENNIAVVGKEEVRNGREMHWIRVDRYYEGDLDAPGVVHQPVPCMHCENAPCETVCPVGATVHSHDGLNQMVYNRCVGTRYCSNNCPYKVRRFNFYQFQDRKTPVLKMSRNPNVTLRPRGVMEKCTYCVQRISAARIEAKKQGRLVEEGEVVTACQQACPSRAITFGDINDPQSEVAKLRASDLNYSILGELNTRPRTTYLARVTDPNPALVTEAESHGGGHGAAHGSGSGHDPAPAGQGHSPEEAEHH